MTQSAYFPGPRPLAARGAKPVGTLDRVAASTARHDSVDIHLARISSGQPHSGVADGGIALVDAGLTDLLRRHGHRLGEIVTYRNDADRVAAFERLAMGIADSVRRETMALTLGGDHSVAFATIEGVLRARPDTRVIYIDAHADLNTPASSPSGNTHGMPVAAHLGMIDTEALPEATCVGARLDADRVGFIGLRDIDPAERDILDERGIVYLTTEETQRMGADAATAHVLNRLDPDGRHPLHVSFDIDSVDPGLAPATGVPVAGGLTLRDLDGIGRTLAATGRMIGLDLVEINPDLATEAGGRAATVDAALRFLDASLGTSASDGPAAVIGAA